MCRYQRLLLEAWNQTSFFSFHGFDNFLERASEGYSKGTATSEETDLATEFGFQMREHKLENLSGISDMGVEYTEP
jgi:hypothetical protein